jgi:hypothetical protein
MFDDFPDPKNVPGARASEIMVILAVLCLAGVGVYHILFAM